MRILRHPKFLAGETDTHFLERHPAAELAAPLCDAEGEKLHAVAAALAAAAARQSKTEVLATIPSGWRNNPSQPERVKYRGAHGEIDVGYRFTRGALSLSIDGEAREGVRVGPCTGEHVELEVGGVQRSYKVHHVDDTYYVDSPLGSSALVELPRFPTTEEEEHPGSLVAPLPGVVDAVKVAVGVSRGGRRRAASH